MAAFLIGLGTTIFGGCCGHAKELLVPIDRGDKIAHIDPHVGQAGRLHVDRLCTFQDLGR
jgi:hypothetical protein